MFGAPQPPVYGILVTAAQTPLYAVRLEQCLAAVSPQEIFMKGRTGGREAREADPREDSTQRLHSHSSSGNTTPEELGVQGSTIPWGTRP